MGAGYYMYKHNLLQTLIERRLQLSGHMCCTSNNRKANILRFGKIDGKNKRGASTERVQGWTDDVVEWCRSNKPLSTEPKQKSEDDEANVGHQRALNP